jgi:hypothetical protein
MTDVEVLFGPRDEAAYEVEEAEAALAAAIARVVAEPTDAHAFGVAWAVSELVRAQVRTAFEDTPFSECRR